MITVYREKDRDLMESSSMVGKSEHGDGALILHTIHSLAASCNIKSPIYFQGTFGMIAMAALMAFLMLNDL